MFTRGDRRGDRSRDRSPRVNIVLRATQTRFTPLLVLSNFTFEEKFANSNVFYSRPRIALAIVEDCYILLVLFLSSSVHRFFDVSVPIFAKLCYTMRYVSKLTPSCGYPYPLKIDNRKPQFSPVCGPIVDTLRPTIP